MIRPGVSRVVVEIIILVIAVALALLIFSPISSYIFGALGRTSTVGGTSTIQILSVSGWDSNSGTIYVKNLGPNDLTISGTTDFQVFVDQKSVSVTGVSATGTWSKDSTVTLTVDLTGISSTEQHNIVVYGPQNTMTQYLYSP